MAQLGDLLAGAAGRPVDRIGLESAVMQGQAMAGLRTSQTEEALAKAQQTREQQASRDRLHESLFQLLDSQGDPNARVNANAATDAMGAGYGDFKTAASAIEQWKLNHARDTLGDVSQLGQPSQTAAQQQIAGAVAPPVNVPGNYAVLPGQTLPDVHQTPGEAAATSEKTASAHLHQAQADAGGFNPHTAGVANLPPDQQAALQQAFDEGRLNYRDVNSRNAGIIGSMALHNPTYNFNRAAADAALSRNSTFQQRAMVSEALPALMQNVVSLGKKLSYSDLQVVGEGQKWLNGQTNDPDLTEFMGARNDVLMKIANVMRGVGMSDKAIEAEQEAMHPTLSPAALDGWLRGQMSTITPLLEHQKRASHIGEPGVGDQSGVDKVPTGTTPPPQGGGDDAPPASVLQEGHVTHFDNGQSWALRGGKPVRVK